MLKGAGSIDPLTEPHKRPIRWSNCVNQEINFYYSSKNPDMMENLRWVPKQLRGIYQAGLTWKDQLLGCKVEVKYMNVPCNAC